MKAYLVWLVGVLFLLSGCAAISLDSGADMVVVSRSLASKDCKFKGVITASQGGSFAGYFTSNKNLAEGAMNELRNKAHKKGANFIAIQTSHAGNTTSDNSGGETDVTDVGSAYFSSPE